MNEDNSKQICAKCKSDEVIAILYGRIPADTNEEYIYGGCCFDPSYDPSWHCKACGNDFDDPRDNTAYCGF